MSHDICMWHVHPLHTYECMSFVMHVQIILQMYSWHPTSICINIHNTHVHTYMHTHLHNYAFCIVVWCDMTMLQHLLLSLFSGATLYFSELLRVAVSL